MKRSMQTLFFLLLLQVIALPLKAQTDVSGQSHGDHTMINKNDFKWMDAPPGLPAGAKVAVLEGDPSKEGPFTMRAIFPANYKIAPHWHPAIEHVTVLEGVFYMGTGDKMDMSKARAIKKDGFAVMPPKFVHYAMTKGKTVVQVHGIGPWGITYVNPSDDPRTNASLR